MQTFLPYPSFQMSALVLDPRRLGKQRVETKQIYLALTQPGYGWGNHPATRMWRGFEGALALYGWHVCQEWRDRDYNDSLLPWFSDLLDHHGESVFESPPWLGQTDFHLSHRSNLLRKDPAWYGPWGWDVPPDLPYIWPTA